jgi:hypothetical protein
LTERAQANAAAPQPVNETFEADADLPLTADEFEVEVEEISYDEPSDHPARPIAAEVDYGWPTG